MVTPQGYLSATMHVPMLPSTAHGCMAVADPQRRWCDSSGSEALTAVSAHELPQHRSYWQWSPLWASPVPPACSSHPSSHSTRHTSIIVNAWNEHRYAGRKYLCRKARPAQICEMLMERLRNHSGQDLVHRLQCIVQDALGA